MTAQKLAEIARSDYDLFNKRNTDPTWLDKIVAHVAEDCAIVTVPLGTVQHGPNGFRDFLLGWLAAFPDCTVEVTDLMAGEDGATVEFIARGTQTGPLRGPTGDAIPPTNRKMELRFCDVMRFRNDNMTSQHTYYDALGLLQQLGLIRPAGATSTA